MEIDTAQIFQSSQRIQSCIEINCAVLISVRKRERVYMIKNYVPPAKGKLYCNHWA